MLYTPLAKNYGIFLPLWLDIILPMSFVVAMYPIFGLPIARAKFRNPMSLGAIIVQGLVGSLVFPILAILSVIVIIHLAKLASPLSGTPIIGLFIASVGSLIPSYRFISVLITTALSAVLGVWCSLGVYWALDRYGISR